MVEKMSTSQITVALTILNENISHPWELIQGKLFKQFKFKNFVAAFSFMASVAILAEKMDHHPEWSNVYSRVDIHLTTHEALGISKRDFDLANAIENIL
ncbi:MAG: 4a-hydroxytetrahydrobiopterin dehydratase [Ghiorsea sp.]